VLLDAADDDTQIMWFVGLGLSAVGFGLNETRYYIMRPQLKGEELDALFHQIAWVHLSVVHVSINGLGFFMLQRIYGWP